MWLGWLETKVGSVSRQFDLREKYLNSFLGCAYFARNLRFTDENPHRQFVTDVFLHYLQKNSSSNYFLDFRFIL